MFLAKCLLNWHGNMKSNKNLSTQMWYSRSKLFYLLLKSLIKHTVWSMVITFNIYIGKHTEEQQIGNYVRLKRVFDKEMGFKSFSESKDHGFVEFFLNWSNLKEILMHLIDWRFKKTKKFISPCLSNMKK